MWAFMPAGGRTLCAGVGGAGGAVGVSVGEEVQARAEPKAGRSTLSIVFFFHLKPPRYLVLLRVMGRVSPVCLAVLSWWCAWGGSVSRWLWAGVWELGGAGGLEVVGGGLGNRRDSIGYWCG
jgi:hypothetical protein